MRRRGRINLEYLEDNMPQIEFLQGPPKFCVPTEPPRQPVSSHWLCEKQSAVVGCKRKLTRLGRLCRHGKAEARRLKCVCVLVRESRERERSRLGIRRARTEEGAMNREEKIGVDECVGRADALPW
jgi:hypothetical protein